MSIRAVDAHAWIAGAAMSLLCASAGFVGQTARAASAPAALSPEHLRAQEQTPPAHARKDVKDVYRDYLRDGVIVVCAHSLAALRRTRATISREFDRDFPDFRDAVNAGIVRHARGLCSHAEPDERVWQLEHHQHSHD